MARSQKWKIIDQYAGPLSPSEAAEGINAAMENARSLAGDARLLLDAGRAPRAASLAILAIEEFGKYDVLHAICTAVTEAARAESWKHYRTHTGKNHLGLLSNEALANAYAAGDLAGLVKDTSLANRKTLDALKQSGFYTDCAHPSVWLTPSRIVTVDLATTYVRAAEALAVSHQRVSPRSMHLWVSHTVGKPFKDGLLSWAAAMEHEGLVSGNYVPKLRSFLKRLPT
ncbi:MAG: hypothetical protein JWN34_1805 [Bryobacterales bacterium]|nr:hypothetical protein [Bryobacterales bacterium]